MAGTGSCFPPAAVVPLMALFLTLPSTCNPVDTPPPPSTGGVEGEVIGPLNGDNNLVSNGGGGGRSSSGGGGPGDPGGSPAAPADPSSSTTSSVSPSGMIHYRRFQRPQRRDLPKADDEEENNRTCAAFFANERQSDGSFAFRSPGWPNSYPNNTDCVRTLEAEPGKILKLDFRDVFYIEEAEDCRFDYLEVRDGAHGYSKLIGNFCGRHFPNIVQSSGRHLWLHFHSDENIEYSGFQAVYEFTSRGVEQPEMEACQINVFGQSDGFVNKSDISTERVRQAAEESLALDCMWRIEVENGWKIQLLFLNFKLEKPNDCDLNFVDVFSHKTDLPSRLKNFCGSIADSVQSTSNVLHVRFYADASAQQSTFESLFTAYRDKNEGCEDEEYDCDDNTCINATLKCNGRKNCRFNWDEDDCSDGISTFRSLMSSEHIIIIMIIFTLILSGMCFAFVFNCVRKLRRDHRIIQEHIRQSREGRLDEAGRISPSIDHVMTTTAFDGDLSMGGDGSLDGSPLGIRARSRSRPGDCCVPVGYGLAEWSPGGKMGDPMLVPPSAPNGDAAFIRNEAAAGVSGTGNSVIGFCSNLASAPSIPEMRDSECQTRESLFQFQKNSGSGKNSEERSVTPPPPPPPSLARSVNMKNSRNAPAFSTFGYGGPTGVPRTLSSRRPDDTQCFRAEAVIEMDAKNGSTSSTQTAADGCNNQSGGRPYSVESSKSAPDVIVTH